MLVTQTYGGYNMIFKKIQLLLSISSYIRTQQCQVE